MTVNSGISKLRAGVQSMVEQVVATTVDLPDLLEGDIPEGATVTTTLRGEELGPKLAVGDLARPGEAKAEVGVDR